jgi:Protein kinase domain/Bacterial Ig-like domain (group 2)
MSFRTGRGGRGGPGDAVALGSNYVLLEPLGRGGMGRVWRGATRRDGEQVAVKLLNPELATDPEVVSRFLQERGILVGLQHPHLVRVRDLVAEGGTLAIVMDLVDGDLRRHLLGSAPLAPAFAAGLMAQVLTGLAAVHAAGIVHRDLKPENILLDRSQGDPPRARLSDFGIARLTTGPGLTRTTGLIGTPEYIAPEMAEQREVGPAADVYAAGIVLYELLTGRTPFAGGTAMAILRRHADETPARPDGLSDGLWELLSEMLAKQPGRRPAAAQAAERLVALVPTLAAASEASGTAHGADPHATRLPGHRPAHGAAAVRTGGMPVPMPLEGPAATPTGDLQTTVLPGRVRAPAPPRPAAAAAPLVRRRTVAIAGVVAAAVLATVAGVALLGRPASPPGPAGGSAVSYTFPAQTQPDGLAVDRTWWFGDARGSRLHEDLRLTNTTGAPLDSSVDEVIPKEIASSAGALRFSPAPTLVVVPDPVVRYAVRGLAPHATQLVQYDASVPPTGASRQRLVSWASSQVTEAAAYQRRVQAAMIAKLIVDPHAVQLAVGESRQLSLSGVDADGTPATAADLGQVGWTSDAPGVVTVDTQGILTAVAPGRARVTAQAGAASDAAAVTVVPSTAGVPGAPAPGGAAPAAPGPAGPAQGPRGGAGRPGPATPPTAAPAPPSSGTAVACVNGANGFTDISDTLSGTVERSLSLSPGVTLTLQAGTVSGAQRGWAKISGGTSAGDRVWMDWTTSAGRTWVRCGPFTVDRAGRSKTTAALRTSPSPSYQLRACGALAGDQPMRCTAWW